MYSVHIYIIVDPSQSGSFAQEIGDAIHNDRLLRDAHVIWHAIDDDICVKLADFNLHSFVWENDNIVRILL